MTQLRETFSIPEPATVDIQQLKMIVVALNEVIFRLQELIEDHEERITALE